MVQEMKKLVSLILISVMICSLAGCSFGGGRRSFRSEKSTGEERLKEAAVSGLKVAFLFPSDSGATDTMSRTEGIRKMQRETGLTNSQIDIEENISKKNCEKKVDTLVSEGYSLIFSKNRMMEPIIVECAKKYPDVEFCQEGGKEADASALPNYHTYYTRLFEAYHVAGMVAGQKLVEMLNNGDVSPENCNIGFVASSDSPAVAACYTAFFTGIQKEYSQAHMLVRYVGGTGVYDNDGRAARQLALANVCIMGQFVSTTAVAAVCAENDIPLIGNDISLISNAPKQALTSATSDWSAYYTYAVNCVLDGKKIDEDWCKGYADGANVISQLNDQHISKETVEKVADLEKKIRKGDYRVFDTETMMINGESLDSLVKNNGEYAKYKKYVKKHTFRESVLRSAPAFDLMIDGIEESTYDYVSEKEAEEAAQREAMDDQ